ncbi:MAG: GTP 3',8-cyclase MoaA [Deltaproteobacteria bacterium]|nr:GTP 3',8-cyclase MoaA [Deltaproteobacteria bacterium]
MTARDAHALLPVDAAAAKADRFGRRIDYLRIAITDRCSLRCVYCMPEAGVPLRPRGELLSFEELWQVAASARRLRFAKFRVTGGEPLEVKDVVGLVTGLRQRTVGATLAITTNGLRLAELADGLRQAGVDLVNVSLDTLRPERYAQITRRDGLARVLAGLDRALQAGFPRVKVNAVIIKGVNDDEVADLAGLAKARPIDVRFIERLPLAGAVERGFVGADLIRKRIDAVYPLEAVAPDDPRQAAQQMFASAALQGQIGIVAARSNKFCACCNRLRLTPMGELKGCLLQKGTIDLRPALRAGISDAALDDLFCQAIGLKPKEYPEETFDLGASMRSVGG